MQVAILAAGLVVGMLVIGVLQSDAVRPVPPDARLKAPTPAPSEPVWRDSFAHCRARLSFHDDHNWRQAHGVEP